jgi:nitrite reductase/ring-hydroxylating ferredoxin subunit
LRVVTTDLVRVCRRDEVAQRDVRRASVGRSCVALFVWQGRVYAIEDECPHRGARLSGSYVDADGFVACPEHGWEFRVDTGEGRGGWEGHVDCFEVVERDGDVYVRVRAPGGPPAPMEAGG